MRRGGRSIYGAPCRTQKQTLCTLQHYPSAPGTIPSLDIVFTSIAKTILTVQKTIQRFFPSAKVVSEFIADMGARMYVSPALYVRITWRQMYAGATFNIENPLQRLQIKDIYLMYGYDWTKDPLFIKYPA
jgi:hypothetical protein